MTHRGPFQPLPFCDSVILTHFPPSGPVFPLVLKDYINDRKVLYRML